MGPEIFRQLRRAARGPRAFCKLGLPLAALWLAAPAQGQVLDSETAEIAGVILAPGSLINTADMDFGQIIAGPTAGTVTLSAAASATCTTTGGIVRAGTCRAARFDMFARRNWKVRLRQNTPTIVLTGPGGATMTVTNVTFSQVGLSPAGNGGGWNLGRWNIDSADGFAHFFLGGRLNVGANQAPGVYNGTVLVEAVFN